MAGASVTVILEGRPGTVITLTGLAGKGETRRASISNSEKRAAACSTTLRVAVSAQFSPAPNIAPRPSARACFGSFRCTGSASHRRRHQRA